MNAVLKVSGAKKRYGDREALRGVDLQLNKGEWLALLGPNGAGKTTMVKSIAGRVKLDSGNLELLGNSLNGKTDIRKKLGIVPQEIALYDTLTAEENLNIFGELHGVKGKVLKDRVKEALAWVALEDRSDQAVQGFSGGMKRRLNIAAAVLHRPEVVLLDEPTVGVDPQSRERIWEMLEGLRKDGASLMLTTHQLDEAQQICDRIVIIDGGQTIANGTLDELIEQTVGKERTLNVICEARDNNGDQVILRHQVHDLVKEMPGILAKVESEGHRIADVKIQTPSLQAVFLHLTGKELRE